MKSIFQLIAVSALTLMPYLPAEEEIRAPDPIEIEDATAFEIEIEDGGNDLGNIAESGLVGEGEGEVIEIEITGFEEGEGEFTGGEEGEGEVILPEICPEGEVDCPSIAYMSDGGPEVLATTGTGGGRPIAPNFRGNFGENESSIGLDSDSIKALEMGRSSASANGFSVKDQSKAKGTSALRKGGKVFLRP
jgi:hypothetical protein